MKLLHLFFISVLLSFAVSCSDDKNDEEIIIPIPKSELIGSYKISDVQTANLKNSSDVQKGDVWVIQDKTIIIGEVEYDYTYNAVTNQLTANNIRYTFSKKDGDLIIKYLKAGTQISLTAEKITDPYPNGIPLTDLIGNYKVTNATTNTEGVWIIQEETIIINEFEYDFTYNTAVNQLTANDVRYTFSKKDANWIIKYLENEVEISLVAEKTIVPYPNEIPLADLQGNYKIIDATVNGVKDAASIGNLWIILESSIQKNCESELLDFVYRNNFFIIGQQKYQVSLENKILTIQYTTDAIKTILKLETTTDVCHVAVDKSKLIGRYKILTSTQEAKIGELWDIGVDKIRISCDKEVSYTYQDGSIGANGINYKISANVAIANNLYVSYVENLKQITLELTPTVDACSKDPNLVVTSNLKKTDVEKLMAKVADWQIGIYTYPSGEMTDFQGGTLHVGMMQWADMAKDKKYLNWMQNEIGRRSKWLLDNNRSPTGSSIFHADDLCLGQFYLLAYDKFRDPLMKANTKQRLDDIIQIGPDETMKYPNNMQSWTWCDALFMAPPLFAQLGRIENDTKYFDFMKKHFKMCYDHLYDKDAKLFYRDEKYFNTKEANGEKVFWSRGQGWVLGGLVNMLKFLPEDYSERPFYESLLVEMLEKIVKSQDAQGFWHASILDMQTFDKPETSGSTLITYAIAYGINNGLLDRAKYVPIAEKAWAALATAVHPNGKLGWVQQVGQKPVNATFDQTKVYGVGGLLLAGVEIHKMAK